MPLIYISKTIETVEEAEQLPDDAILFNGNPADGQTYTRAGDDWHTDNHPGVLSLAIECGCLATALIPVEAEEETTRPVHLYSTVAHVAPHSVTDAASVRYVTPWRPAFDERG